MLTTLLIFLAAAIITASAGYWTLRAYRNAGGRRARGSLMLCGAVALVALGVYLLIGRPDLPDAPYEARLAALKQRDPTTYTADEALAVLNEAARAEPTDPRPHFYSGQIHLGQGRPREAARAYDAALRRDPRNAEALVGLGRALVAIEDGRLTPEALAAFQQAATLTEDPAPWLYQAIAAMEAGEGGEARRLWGEAYRRMAPNDPRREMALRMSREAGR